ncbi:hypothetical protein pb186bvf_001138 [Paramecium bursaria]
MSFLKFLDPVIDQLGLRGTDNIEPLKGPCAKIGVRPSQVIVILGGIAVFMMLLGLAQKFLSTFIGVLYPSYKSIQALSSSEKDDDKQWLTYWVVFSTITVVDSSFGFVLEFIPFYHLIRLALFVSLFHPKLQGAQVIYDKFIAPNYVKYHEQLEQQAKGFLSKAEQVAKEKLANAQQ